MSIFLGLGPEEEDEKLTKMAFTEVKLRKQLPFELRPDTVRKTNSFPKKCEGL